MKKFLLLLAAMVFGLGLIPASAQNYNFNIGGLQHSSGPSVPGACSRAGSWFYKNTSTRAWYICNGATYDVVSTGGSSSGTVTGVLGTANQIVSDGSTTTPTLSIASTFTFPGTVTNNLSIFAATTSAQLAGVLSDETGSGSAVFATSPTLVTPLLGTPTSGTLTNTTGYKWDQLANPGGNQTLTMTGDSTTWNWGATNTNQFKFDANGNPTWGLVSATTAVTNSPTLTISGSYQNASTPTFVADSWSFQDVIGAGTNGTTLLTLSHSGSAGTAANPAVPTFKVSAAGAFANGTITSQMASGDALFARANGQGQLILGLDGLAALDYGISVASRLTLSGASLAIPNGNVYGITSGAKTAAIDVGISRGAAGLLDIGTGTGASTAGFFKTAQTLAVTTADVTCGTGGTISSCTTFQTITGLSVALPLVAANWSFDCTLIVGQATAAAANQIGVQTATNGATNIAATATAYTAAAVSTSASITGVASTTTAQSIITFTPGATGTKMPIYLKGTIEGSSVSGTTLNVTALTGAAADLLTIYRGSQCYVY